MKVQYFWEVWDRNQEQEDFRCRVSSATKQKAALKTELGAWTWAIDLGPGVQGLLFRACSSGFDLGFRV